MDFQDLAGVKYERPNVVRHVEPSQIGGEGDAATTCSSAISTMPIVRLLE